MRLRILAALPVALTLALTAGCGGDDGGEGVASAEGTKDAGTKGTGTKGGATGGGTKLSRDEMGVKFAQCMRENGVHMDDPKPGEPVRLMIKDVPKATVDKAMETCRQYNPQANATGAPDPAQQERGRKFAECMRRNGVEKFPDPKPGQRGIMIDKRTVGDDPDLESAQRACQDVLQGGRK
ncbi:hypothetical protein BZB76_4550 [Actinomadura pelletieri DSM 43383]|uniref:Subtilisin inhibitor-like n=1 Tax=Actinomadura pelletieri DSM 43383 TaxID=1120940 RepID=A0A495QHY2_9ACTN|nr:hypothetical protein [Actinomadura pelletieri]RKS71743.1 hypothetical protein BZB76_4550 [Actinomadura pelletieri DSM 43383]